METIRDFELIRDIDSAIRRLEMTRPLVFLDVETTGTNLESDRVVTLGLLRVEPDSDSDSDEVQIELMFKPPIKITPEATAVHGITDEMVAECPSFKDSMGKINPFFEDDPILVGHNIRRFDYPMLAAEFAIAGHSFGYDTIDTFLFFKARFGHSLAAAYRLFAGRELAGAHGALADALALPYVLAGLVSNTDLPADMDLLVHTPPDPDWIDGEGKFVWRNGEAVLTIGKKTAGRTLRQIASTDRGFLEWMLDKDFSSEVLDIVEKALRGEFPERKDTNLNAKEV